MKHQLILDPKDVAILSIALSHMIDTAPPISKRNSMENEVYYRYRQLYNKFSNMLESQGLPSLRTV